jgi:hypothetical protein
VARHLFERRPPRPDNRRLRAAIERLATQPGAENRALVHSSLLAGPLLVALRELPRDLGPDPEAVARELPVEFVTHAGPGGQRVLAGFSDPEAVAARAPAGVWLSVEPATLLDWVAQEGLAGLLLNPQGPSAFIPLDEVRALLGLPPLAGKRRHSLSLGDAPNQNVAEALEKLLQRGADAAVEITEARTGRGLRFRRSGEDALLLVLPAASLSRDESERARLLFDELAGLDDDDPAPPGAAPNAGSEEWLALFSGDVGRAARAAVKVFTWVFGFPPGFDLEFRALRRKKRRRRRGR